MRATDATGRTGPARQIELKVDGTPPRAAGWFEPRSGTDRITGAVVELGWRALEDTGSGIPRLQRVQRQIARPDGESCQGVAWADDGPTRLVVLHDEQWDLRSARCYRWILVPLDGVGNAGHRAISGSVYVDLLAPRADFSTPDEGTQTVIGRATFRVAWTERRRIGGGETTRTLERERVHAVDGACPTLGWVRQGTVDRGPSPSLASHLRPGFCYRWRLNLVDDRDNAAAELSGVVRVIAP